MDERRELYFSEAIRYLPRILELADRNRLSKTYGSFDRSFWHYRTSDFPSGMAQEAVLPLALAYSLYHPNNPFYAQERIKELVWAGMDFARRTSHRDGSCDDYFPYERASGATAFSLYAATEAILLLQEPQPELLAFLKQRGSYLAGSGFEESGVLSNHKALIVLGLYNLFLLTKENFFKEAAEHRLSELLNLQNQEGWFPEYGGCDPGYLTFTIDFLAKYHQKSKDPKVVGPLQRAVNFASYFMQPDGSFAGEYGSRNTFHFLPHGFELVGREMPPALRIADRFLQSLEEGKRSSIDDDRIFCHYVYNFFQSYIDFAPRSVGTSPYPSLSPGGGERLGEGENAEKFFSEAGLFVKRSKDDCMILSVRKGGTGKIFRGGKLLWSDTGLVGRSSVGKKFISQTTSDCEVSLRREQLTIEGDCFQFQEAVFTPFLFVIFRLGLLLVARFLSPNWVRRLVQKKAITKRLRKFPLKFKKVFKLEDFRPPEITLWLKDRSVKIKELWISTDATFIYVATSQPFQPGCLKPWIDLSEFLPVLNQEGTVNLRPDAA